MKKLLALAAIIVLISISCKKDEPAPAPPALTIVSIKSGSIDLNGGTSATKVSTTLPIVVSFSTELDVATATSASISLKQGTSSVTVDISVTENGLDFGTSYSLTINNSIKSDRGVALSNPASISFATEEPSKVYFYQVISTPTDLESITLKNNSGTDQDVSSWTIGDTNSPMAYKIPAGTTIKQGETKSFSHTTIGFAINDNGEILYLKNAAGAEIDRWTN
jgi:hypothetical protein